MGKAFLELTIHAVYECAAENRNNVVLLLEREHTTDNMKYSAFINAVTFGHNDIILLITRSLPDIRSHIFADAFDNAAGNGHNDTLLLLKNIFPNFMGTSKSFIDAAYNRHNETIRSLIK